MKTMKRQKSTSNHYFDKRFNREKLIKKFCNGDGFYIEGFVIDRGHKHGAEVHSITDTGLIIVHNYYTGKLVTKLIARPEQIKRYYKKSGKQAPKWLLDIAEWHKDLCYNYY